MMNAPSIEQERVPERCSGRQDRYSGDEQRWHAVVCRDPAADGFGRRPA